MRAGILTGLAVFGAAGVALAQEEPSFDCAGAGSRAEELVCSTPELAQLDREMARLHELALNGPHMTAERRKTELAPTRGRWVKERDACWKAKDVPACVKKSYVRGIAHLRQAYADARSDDAAGISIGPLVAECPGLDALVGTTFVNSDPGALDLAWRDREVVLDQVRSGSGARYEATLDDGHYLFWNKGDRAEFEAPGVDGTLDCVLSELG